MELLGANAVMWAAILVTLATAVIAGIMFVLGSERLHYLWGIFCVFVSMWSLAFFVVTQSTTPESAQFWWKIAYVGIIFNPVVFFHFTLEFAQRMRRVFVVLAYVIGLAFIYVDLTTNLIVDQMRFVFGFYYDSPAGYLNPYLVLFFVILVVTGHIAVFLSYRKSKDPIFRQRTEYFFLATSIGFTGAALNFFPAYGIDISPVTIVTVIVAWPLIGYAILRYGLFNIRVVTAQLLTLVLTVFALIHIVLSRTQQELMLNALLLLTTFGVGIYLIKSVRKEVEQREHIEKLAQDLEKANVRLKELDQMKSEFLSLATHQIRGPLTAIKGYASLLLEGSYGKLPAAPAEAVEKIFHSSDSLALLVEDFLNISRIEQGKMKYDFVDTDMEALIREVAGELAPNVAKAKLQFGVSTDGRGPYKAKVDVGKIRQVIANLIDNAIKYTPSGSISVGLEKSTEGKIRIEVSDTGIGIDPETIPTLFNKFIRAKDASKTNVSGTGLGLYVAKEMIKAHGGRIWVESAGKGHGSIFFVELKAL